MRQNFSVICRGIRHHVIEMKSIVKLKVVVKEENYPMVREVLQKFNLQRPWDDVVEIPLDKDDPRRAALTEELKAVGYEPLVHYDIAFEKEEVERAELLHFLISNDCGPGFVEWARVQGLPDGVRVIDKREMRNQDIAKTYAFEVIISDRVIRILHDEGLTGWDAKPVLHIDQSKDSFPPYFHLTATKELPPLAPMTDIHRVVHDTAIRWPPGHPLEGSDDPLLGTSALFARGPLYYHRSALGSHEDFNRTYENFGEKPQAQPLLLISQKAWRAFKRHGLRNVSVEPVTIIDL